MKNYIFKTTETKFTIQIDIFIVTTEKLIQQFYFLNNVITRTVNVNQFNKKKVYKHVYVLVLII